MSDNLKKKEKKRESNYEKKIICAIMCGYAIMHHYNTKVISYVCNYLTVTYSQLT